MKFERTIDKHGRITVPVEIREALDLMEKADVVMSLYNSQIVITPIKVCDLCGEPLGDPKTLEGFKEHRWGYHESCKIEYEKNLELTKEEKEFRAKREFIVNYESNSLTVENFEHIEGFQANQENLKKTIVVEDFTGQDIFTVTATRPQENGEDILLSFTKTHVHNDGTEDAIEEVVNEKLKAAIINEILKDLKYPDDLDDLDNLDNSEVNSEDLEFPEE